MTGKGKGEDTWPLPGQRWVPRHDIAVVVLPRPPQLSALVQAACWGGGGGPDQEPDTAVVVGWRRIYPDQVALTSSGVYSNNQYKLQVN